VHLFYYHVWSLGTCKSLSGIGGGWVSECCIHRILKALLIFFGDQIVVRVLPPFKFRKSINVSLLTCVRIGNINCPLRFQPLKSSSEENNQEHHDGNQDNGKNASKNESRVTSIFSGWLWVHSHAGDGSGTVIASVSWLTDAPTCWVAEIVLRFTLTS